MSILTKLEVHRIKWIQMLTNMGCNEEFIEDVIHDMYLKIYKMKDHEKIVREDGDVNIFYIYRTLNSCFINHVNENANVSLGNIYTDLLVDDPLDVDAEVELMSLYMDMLDEMNEFGQYGSKLCKVYLPTDRSLRQIASESGISLTSIYNSVKQYKAILREEFKEQYETYKRNRKD